VKHITQVLQERSGEKKGSQAKRQERKQKEYQPSNEDKGDKTKLLEGRAATTLKKTLHIFGQPFAEEGRSQWPRDLRRRSVAARLLRSWVRILPGAWMFVCYECFVLSGRGLCDELITRPEESYRL